MHPRNRSAYLDIRQILWDILSIAVSYFLADRLFLIVRQDTAGIYHTWLLLVFAIVFVLTMFCMRMYNVATFQYWNRILMRVLGASVMGAMCVTMVIFLAKAQYASRLLFVTFCVISFFLVLGQRFARRQFYRSEAGNGYTHVLFVGEEEVKDKYHRFLKKTFCRVKIDEHITYGCAMMGSYEAFEQYLTTLTVDEVVFMQRPETSASLDLRPYLQICENMGITAKLLLDYYDLSNSRRFINSIGTFPQITYHTVPLNRGQLFLKEVGDRVCAAIALTILSPVILAAAIAIKFTSPGPVFFKQKRAGMNGRVFTMYKFRSMYMDAEERKQELLAQNKYSDNRLFKLDNDPRITRVGRFIRKTSIDEIPQLWNVLKGDMSLVGTRPPTLDEVERYEPRHRRRISIKPGITGMWQVSGRNNITDFEQVVKLDAEYIDKWSLLLDLKLLYRTFGAVMGRTGAK